MRSGWIAPRGSVVTEFDRPSSAGGSTEASLAKAVAALGGETGSWNREPRGPREIPATGFSKRAGSKKASGRFVICRRGVAQRGPQSREELRRGAGWRGLHTLRHHVGHDSRMDGGAIGAKGIIWGQKATAGKAEMGIGGENTPKWLCRSCQYPLLVVAFRGFSRLFWPFCHNP